MKFMRCRRMLPLFLVAVVLPMPVLAEETFAVVPANPGEVRTLDEIVVTGRLGSLSSAWQALIEAEDRFYARYNELNKDDSMDIVCRVEARTGTRIEKRTCQPRVVDDTTRNEAERFLRTTNGNVKPLQPDDMKAELKTRTMKMLAGDPQLLRALLERARLEQYFRDLRAQKLSNGNLIWD